MLSRWCLTVWFAGLVFACGPPKFGKYASQVTTAQGSDGRSYLGTIDRQDLDAGGVATEAGAWHPDVGDFGENIELDINGGRACHRWIGLSNRPKTDREILEKDKEMRKRVSSYFSISSYKDLPTAEAWPTNQKATISSVTVDRTDRPRDTSDDYVIRVCGAMPTVPADHKWLVLGWVRWRGDVVVSVFEIVGGPETAPTDLPDPAEGSNPDLLDDPPAPGTTAAPTKRILETLRATKRFSTFVKAIEATELAEILAGDGPFTVFAPTDAAFAKYAPAERDAWFADKTNMTNHLKLHVMPAAYASSFLDTRKGARYPTLWEPYTIFLDYNTDKFRVENALGTAAEIPAINGLIYGVDSVLQK